MAVYKKTYRPYDGNLTPSATRFLVIPRFAFEDMRKSRFLTIFFLASFIYPLIAALTPAEILDDAVRGLSSYHTRPIVVRLDHQLQIDDVKLLYYYQNRTAHVPPEQR